MCTQVVDSALSSIFSQIDAATAVTATTTLKEEERELVDEVVTVAINVAAHVEEHEPPLRQHRQPRQAGGKTAAKQNGPATAAVYGHAAAKQNGLVAAAAGSGQAAAKHNGLAVAAAVSGQAATAGSQQQLQQQSLSNTAAEMMVTIAAVSPRKAVVKKQSDELPSAQASLSQSRDTKDAIGIKDAKENTTLKDSKNIKDEIIAKNTSNGWGSSFFSGGNSRFQREPQEQTAQAVPAVPAAPAAPAAPATFHVYSAVDHGSGKIKVKTHFFYKILIIALINLSIFKTKKL